MAQEEQKRIKRRIGSERTRGSLRSQTIRLGDGETQVITGILKVRINGNQNEMLENAIIRDIKVDQIITGPKGELEITKGEFGIIIETASVSRNPG